MYKYTYELSQSYRTDASHNAQIYHSLKVHSKPNPHNIATYQPNIKKYQSQTKPAYNQSKSKFDVENLKQAKDINKIEVKRYEPYKRGQYQPLNKAQKTLSNYEDADIQTKLRRISEKYSHNSSIFYNKENNQLKKNDKAQINMKFQNKIASNSFNSVCKFSQTIKNNESFNFQVQRPLREVNKKIKTLNQQQNWVSRAKVKSEIAAHLHKTKDNLQFSGPQSKKYDYGINKQQLIPAKDKEENTLSNGTIAKLTSLQQRIKSTVEPFIHY